MTGAVEAKRLEPGQSLELVVSEIFDAEAGIIDEQTRDDLRAHKDDVRKLQRSASVDWTIFFERRRRLLELNDEVRTLVAMQEMPVRKGIEAVSVRVI